MDKVVSIIEKEIMLNYFYISCKFYLQLILDNLLK